MGGNRTHSTAIVAPTVKDIGATPKRGMLMSFRGGAQNQEPAIVQKYNSYMEKRSQKMAQDEQIRTIRRLERMEFINSIPHQSVGTTVARTLNVFNGNPLSLTKRDFG